MNSIELCDVAPQLRGYPAQIRQREPL